jgi:hypothetical protein
MTERRLAADVGRTDLKRAGELGRAAAFASILVLGACSGEPAKPSDTDRPVNRSVETSGPAVPTAEDAASFALGNTSFVLFHEIGHALISEFELPVLGREEDAVDNFASVLLSPDEDDPERDASILTNAIAGWFLSAEMTALEDIAWWDEHGPDQQRAYQIACLLYGSEAGAYDQLAEEIGLPEERRGRCPTEYQATLQSWTSLLQPHMLADGAAAAARVSVTYEDAGEYVAEQELLRESRLMETTAEEISTTFRLPRNIQLRGSVCGAPNAFWDPQTAQITICYELVREYLQLHAGLAARASQD